MAHSIEFDSAADEELEALPKNLNARIIKAILLLADNPRPRGCKKLKGEQNAYRIRIGDYRVIYEVYDDVLVVLVIRVAHRREVYKD
jgi:mRNA interferase RelE/StbE